MKMTQIIMLFYFSREKEKQDRILKQNLEKIEREVEDYQKDLRIYRQVVSYCCSGLWFQFAGLKFCCHQS
jgi:hypothetical protein